jgi:BolA protein
MVLLRGLNGAGAELSCTNNRSLYTIKGYQTMSLGPIGQRITRKLTDAFTPAELDVIDESHKHAGHAGARPEGETHFKVVIVADAFGGQSLVERHRAINNALAEELADRVHALSISAKGP